SHSKIMLDVRTWCSVTDTAPRRSLQLRPARYSMGRCSPPLSELARRFPLNGCAMFPGRTMDGTLPPGEDRPARPGYSVRMGPIVWFGAVSAVHSSERICQSPPG